MPCIISTPWENATGCDEAHHFAYYETIGRRPSQEDALTWQTFDAGELDALNPEQIGHRLWTTYKILNTAESIERVIGRMGTTACTTVVKDNYLITATLGDAVAFAVIYDETGAVVKVERLNKRTHKPTDADEAKRIKDAGGYIYTSTNGTYAGNGLIHTVAVSRALGDFDATGVCADANIDISTLPEDAYHVQIITTCDGFTDGAGTEHQTKEDHETYLKNTLNAMNGGKPGKLAESIVAEGLANRAIGDGSTDNISIAVQSIKTEGRPATQKTMVGIYDGHGGIFISHFVAENIGKELSKQLKLSESDYADQEYSVQNNADIYNRDHPDARVTAGAGAGAGAGARPRTARASVSPLGAGAGTSPLAAGVGPQATGAGEYTASLARTSSPPRGGPILTAGSAPKATNMSETLEREHNALVRQIDTFLGSVPKRHGRLTRDLTAFKSALTLAAGDLKENRINLKGYGRRCTQAIADCERAFKGFRRENTVYQTYFGPWIRKLLSCLGGEYQEERNLDLQVQSSLRSFSLFKKKVEVTENKKEPISHVSNPLRKG